MHAPAHPGNLALQPSPSATVEFGRFSFDLGDCLLYRDGRQIALPPRALAVLAHLVQHSNQVVTKQALMDAVWKDTFVEEASLKEAVSLVRQALEEDAQQPRFIQTIHRRGYRFVMPASLPISRIDDPAHGIGPSARHRRRRLALLAVASFVPVLAALAALGMLRSSDPPAVRRPVRFTIPLAQSVSVHSMLPALAISSDGSRIVFIGKRGGTQRLYERRLDRLDTQELPGTEEASAPFFSPDGKWIAFFGNGVLEKLSMDGGAPLVVCQTPDDGAGGTWLPDGTMVFGSGFGLFRVAASGGTASPLTRIDAGRGEIGHWWPHVLPDGDSIIFTTWKTGLDRASLAVVSVRTGAERVLFQGAADGRYLASGHLLFARSGGVASVAFDLARLRVTGSPVPVPLDAIIDPFEGIMQAAVADDGTLVYAAGSAETPRFVPCWVDKNGAVTPLALPARPYRNLRLSPDGRQIAATINEASDYDVWIANVDRGTITRLTFGGRNIEPVWSPDGQSVIYAASVSSPFALMRRRADGSGSVEQLLTSDQPYFPWSLSSDGRTVMFGTVTRATGFDLWALPVQADRKPQPFLRSTFQEFSAAFAPDGRAVAYVSTESGRDEVYVRPFPGPGGKWQVSTGGGVKPFWSRDGRRLFYSDDDTLMGVDIRWDTEPAIGRPAAVMTAPGMAWFGTAPDGRILALESQAATAGPSSFTVVLNWLDAVRDRLNAGS